MPTHRMTIGVGFVVMALAGAVLGQTNVYVDTNATGPGHDGASWCTAYREVHAALSAAGPNTIVRVADGTYLPDLTGLADPRAATFQLINGVTLKGGYAGCGATDPDDRDVGGYETILSGDIGAAGVVADNSYHVVTGSGTIATAVLDGFTITGGYADGGGWEDLGAGMNNTTGSPTLRDCTFRDNNCAHGGAGMYNRASSSPALTNCTFQDNTAATFGGGMHNYDNSRPVLDNCLFIGNTATDGGGLQNHTGCNATLTNCTFTGNTATTSGGALHCVGSSPTLANCVLWGNTAPAAAAIHDDATSASTVTYSCIQDAVPGDGSVPYGGAANGNIDTDPLFAAVDDARLLPGSPCIDAADNAAAAGIATDLDGYPRFVDDLDTVDTGVGTPPIVDMGVYEYWPDCNTNGVPDDVDVAEGTSADCNTNGLPDECETLPAGVVYVDDSAVGGLNDGSIWTDAFVELADALTFGACRAEVIEIRVAGGTYSPDVSGLDDPRGATFSLVSGLAIYGGYAGSGNPADPDARDIALYETVLSGDLLGNNDPDAPAFFVDVLRTEDCYHVVTSHGTDATAVLDGFTITAGHAHDVLGGGGLHNTGSPTLARCIFRKNLGSSQSSQVRGGGMYNGSGGNPTLIDCTFSGNQVGSRPAYPARGGGMYSRFGSPTLINCTFSGNSTVAGTSSGAGDGAGMYIEGGSTTLTNCTFSGNWVDVDGDGGGLYNFIGSTTLTNCTFSGNWIELRGGDGGGMYSLFGSPTLTNCTFSGNSADGGGGGGMYNDQSTPTLANCILWGNTALTGAQIDDSLGSTTTATYSCIEGGWPGDGNIGDLPAHDPLFVDVDGPDDIPGTTDDDVRLSPGSPCINAGDDASLPADALDLDEDGDAGEPIPIDLDGHARVLCGGVDMGPYEFGIGDYDCDDDVDLADYAAWQRCVTGEDGGPYATGCEAFDYEYDGDVDLDDFTPFQLQFAGS